MSGKSRVNRPEMPKPLFPGKIHIIDVWKTPKKGRTATRHSLPPGPEWLTPLLEHDLTKGPANGTMYEDFNKPLEGIDDEPEPLMW